MSARLKSLVDKYLDEGIDKATYLNKKAQIETELKELDRQITKLSRAELTNYTKLEAGLELAKNLYLIYSGSKYPQKMQFVRFITSNLEVDGKTASFSLRNPFSWLTKTPPLGQRHAWLRIADLLRTYDWDSVQFDFDMLKV